MTSPYAGTGSRLAGSHGLITQVRRLSILSLLGGETCSWPADGDLAGTEGLLTIRDRRFRLNEGQLVQKGEAECVTICTLVVIDYTDVGGGW